MKVKVKKIVAIVMLILLMINSLPLSSFAAFITDINSDAEFGVVSGSLGEYNHELHYAKYDGSTYLLFCTQYGKKSPTGRDYEYGSEFLAEFKENRAEYQNMAEMIYFGYAMNHGMGLPGSHDAKVDACCTQQYVWETLGNAPSRDSWDSSYMSSSKYSSWLSKTQGYYNQYHSNVSFNGSSHKVNIGESTTLSDSNGVLAHFPSFSKNIGGVTYSHDNGSNDLRVNVSDNASTTNAKFNTRDYGIYELMPNGASYNSGTMSNYVYFEFTSGLVQNLMFSNFIDPSTFSVSVEVQSGKVQVKKTNTIGNPVANCSFELYKDQACTQKVSSGNSNSNGTITFEKLKPGTYFVKETSVPKGYLIDNTVKSVNVVAGQTASVEFKNNEPTGEIYIYKVSENNDKVGQADFQIIAAENITNVAKTKTYYTKGQVVDTITTEIGTGMASKKGLPLGKYIVKEVKVPTGYLLNETEFPVNLEYKDNKTPVIELKVEGVLDKEPRGKITIEKKDKETGSIPQGDAEFVDATYEVFANEDIYNVAKTKKFYSKGDLVATRTMNEEGKTEDVENLPLGKYIVKEKIASKGYLLDKTTYNVELKYKDQVTPIISDKVTSNEEVKKMKVHIFKSGIKVNSGETPGLEGAEFTIKLNRLVEEAYSKGYTYAEVWNGVDELGNKVEVDSQRVQEAQTIAPTYARITTDRDGNAYTQKNLPYGKYIVKETITPKDYETAVDFTFSITQDETEVKEVAQKSKHLVVNNEQLESYVKLIKKDLKTGKIVVLNSATFKIKAQEDIYDRATKKILWKKGEYITQKLGRTTYDSFTTNAKNIIVPDKSYTDNLDIFGGITIPLQLPVGSYEIDEIRTPKGFLQLEKSVKFKIEGIRDFDKDQDGDPIVEVVVKNEQPTGTLIIDKEIALRENVDTSLIDTSDLSGIEFKLSAKENIISPIDGSIIYKKGQEVKTYNLDKDGNLKVEELPMGVYEIQETKTLDGLVLNDKVYEVKFEQKDLVTKVYEVKLDISNDTTIFDFSKTDVTGDKELPGAKLKVTNKEGKVIDEWTSTENKHTIEGLVVGNEYTMTEEIAPDGYVKATSITFKVENTKEVQHVQMKDKIVDMSKVDIGGEEIEGAEIKVYDEEGNIVDEWTSTKEEHKIKGLEEGKKYTLHEEVAPDGYVKATDVEFEVTTDKENQHIDLIDKVVEISKEDIAGKEIEGAKLQVLDKDGNVIDEWTSTKEPHKVTGLTEGETYKLHEEVAIGDYVKASDIKFKVTTDKETEKHIMIDKLVEIVKTDLVTGEEVEGAELQVVDEEGNIIDEWTSTKEAHKVPGLEEGKQYKLIEKTAPYGYELTEEIEFVVTTDKETQKVEMKDMPILKDIQLTKIDSKTKEVILEKFTFGLYIDEECKELIQQVDSNKETGTILFDDVRYGTYYIKEITAPKGYEKSDKVVKVEINDKGVFVDDKEINEKDNIYNFEFENAPIETPNTGDNSHLKLIGGVMILSLLGLILLAIKLFKKDKDNKKK